MSKYVYPAVFVPEDKGMYSISFPDIEDCITCGDNLPHAMEMAGDALSLMLYDMEEEGGEIPPATPLNDIQTEGGAFVTYISADTLEYRKRFNNKAVKKTLTIPEWLNEAAAAAGVNFSQVLQDALKAQLHLGQTYPISKNKKPPLPAQGKLLGYTRRMASNNMKII